MKESLVLMCFALFGVSLALTNSTPSLDPESYSLRYRSPDVNCEPTTTCSYFMGISVNSEDASYIDVFLSGVAEGWVAVGFSPTRIMSESDVIGCNVQTGTSLVLAVDTYNVVVGTNNLLDSTAIQSDIIQGTSEFVDGRITCTFSRLIEGIDPQPVEDRNLDDSFFLMFGTGPTGRSVEGPGRFEFHGPGAAAPEVSNEQINVVQEVGEIAEMDLGPANATPPMRDPEDYRLRARIPSGCDPLDCEFYMGIDTNANNSDFLDFYLVGDVDGWVAAGFTTSQNMLNADVVGCNVDPGSGEVFAVDTFNPSNARTNTLDITQDDIVLHTGQILDGRIVCEFSRQIIGNSGDDDLDLNDDYYVLFGLGDNGGGAGNFPDHRPGNPPISDQRVNPAVDEGEIGVSIFRRQLIQVHGILMLIAWPLLAFTAIFFAAWMKPALPNGEWFQVHRAFNLAGLFVAVVAFILVFVAHKDNDGLITLGDENPDGTTHYILGIIIMALQIANPIISIFRCKPNGNYRWIFNIIHGTIIGIGVELLAYVNIGIGLSIFSVRLSTFGNLTMLWVFLAFAIFATILTVVLFVFFTGEAAVSEDGAKLAPSVIKGAFSSSSTSKVEVELSTVGSSEPKKPDGPPARKPPSRDAPFRWTALGVFLGVMVPIIIALIIMIAVRV